MSESNTNPQALFAATMPPLLPVGFVCNGGHIGMQLRPAANVLLLPKELIRYRQDGETGATTVSEVFAENAEARPDGAADDWVPKMIPADWRKPVEGEHVHELGTPLPPEKCVVVFMLMSGVVDTLEKGIVRIDRGPRQRQESVIAHKILAVIPLDVFQREHVGQLRGPTS